MTGFRLMAADGSLLTATEFALGVCRRRLASTSRVSRVLGTGVVSRASITIRLSASKLWQATRRGPGTSDADHTIPRQTMTASAEMFLAWGCLCQSMLKHRNPSRARVYRFSTAVTNVCTL